MISLCNSNFEDRSPYLIFSGAFVTPAVKDKYTKLKEYCMKEESRIAGPWQIIPGDIYMGEDIITRDMLWPWQTNLLILIEEFKIEAARKRFAKRDVIFVADTKGSAGKSSFCKFLHFHNLAGVFGYGSPRDLMYEVISQPPKLVYLFDLTRARPQDSSFADTCSAIENLKNGTIHNLKYRVETRLQKPALVIVFANFVPTDSQKSMLSMDRWIVIELTPEHIPADVRQEREADIARRNAIIGRFATDCKFP